MARIGPPSRASSSATRTRWPASCAKAGLVGLNIVAIDGSKIAANASRDTNAWPAK